MTSGLAVCLSFLSGVTIGQGAIIGAGSVVTSSIPPWTVIAGNPARIIRELTQQNAPRLGSWEEAVLWLRTQPDQQQLVRCFYDDPLLDAAARYYASTEWIAVRGLLKGNRGMALDLGAGRGISSYALARDGWKVSALEPDPSEVVGAGAIRSLARDAKLDIGVEQENWGESLPYPDATFDLVYGRQVLHHARDLHQLCREAARVLKPGGTFVATREHVISRAEDLRIFWRRILYTRCTAESMPTCSTTI